MNEMVTTHHVRHIFMPIDQIINKVYMQCTNLLNQFNPTNCFCKEQPNENSLMLKTNSIPFLIDLVYILVQNWKF